MPEQEPKRDSNPSKTPEQFHDLKIEIGDTVVSQAHFGGKPALVFDIRSLKAERPSVDVVLSNYVGNIGFTAGTIYLDQIESVTRGDEKTKSVAEGLRAIKVSGYEL